MNEAAPIPGKAAGAGGGTASGEALCAFAAACGLSRPDWLVLVERARGAGSDPFDLALGEGVLSEIRFLAALAAVAGAEIPATPPPPLPETDPAEAMMFRSYPALGSNGRVVRVLAPGGAAVSALIPGARRRAPAVLATRQGFVDALMAGAGDRIARLAALGLPAPYSARSAAVREEARGFRSHAAILRRAARAAAFVVPFLLAGAALIFHPLPALVLPPLLIAPVFIIAGLAVLTATFESAGAHEAPPAVEAPDLPRYSILVPLYREANVIDALVARLSRLSYPRDRIEAFILVETDDVDTRTALRAARVEPWMNVLVVPEGAPRTKPRALNAALPFCTGELLVVFDAEDAPEPDQLLRAAALFRAAPGDVACIQARLAISNSGDNFLTRRFAIDYATLFDCVKAGSARAGWPVPLGGSSNHFRTSVLRRIGGWDAWNVTEDADLGLRLARFGWLVADLPSTTWEEAPDRWCPWLKQRTRWMKGWLQTVLVHARAPRRFVRELGPFRAMVVAAMAIAVMLGALLYPAFAIAVPVRLLMPAPLGGGGPMLLVADSVLVLAIAVTVLAELIPPVIALGRRQALHLFPWVLLAPVTHIMVSIAAWRALIEFLRAPYHWHKTMHGTARSTGGLHPIRPD